MRTHSLVGISTYKRGKTNFYLLTPLTLLLTHSLCFDVRRYPFVALAVLGRPFRVDQGTHSTLYKFTHSHHSFTIPNPPQCFCCCPKRRPFPYMSITRFIPSRYPYSSSESS